MLNIPMSRPEQTVCTQIKLLLQEQFNQGLHLFAILSVLLDTSKDSQIDLLILCEVCAKSKYI